MIAKNEKEILKKATEIVLQKKKKDYKGWKQNVIDQKKLEVMADKDKDWSNKIIQEASIQLILENLDLLTQNDITNHQQ